MADTNAARYYIGLMSGTSLDGVDGVIVDDLKQQIVAQIYQVYTPKLKQNLRELTQTAQTSLANLATIDIQIATAFSEVVLALLVKANLDANSIIAIGSHGQTIYHQGGEYSMQIGHGALIAEQTNITTVADFRMQDVAAGGQGAPLAPLYHQQLLGDKDGVIINLGGIANITRVKNGDITGFDTGPANTLLDCWTQRHQALDYDDNGRWARGGVVNQALLDKMLADKYFQMSPPKSTGTEYFNLDWLAQFLTVDMPVKDVQRTLLELTAISISSHIFADKNVYLCGGGVRNDFLLERFKKLNPHTKIMTTSALGTHPDYVEAAAFAYFAKQTLAGKPSNLTAVTGAKHTRILGAIYAVKKL
jgi:anhydro-N-acetylmuramic acid kinase